MPIDTAEAASLLTDEWPDEVAYLQREAAAAALARVRERVVAIDTFGIFDPAGYRIDSAPAMRAAVLAIIEEEAGR